MECFLHISVIFLSYLWTCNISYLNSALEWIVHSGNDDFAELTANQLSEKRICSTHFSPSDINTRCGKNVLIDTAVPIDINENNNVDSEIFKNYRENNTELIEIPSSSNENYKSSAATETPITNKKN